MVTGAVRREVQVGGLVVLGLDWLGPLAQPVVELSQSDGARVLYRGARIADGVLNVRMGQRTDFYGRPARQTRDRVGLQLLLIGRTRGVERVECAEPEMLACRTVELGESRFPEDQGYATGLVEDEKHLWLVSTTE